MSEITWEPVSSSSVAAIAHADDTLYVRFVNSKEYAYHGISHSEFEAIKESSSVGREIQRLGRGGVEL